MRDRIVERLFKKVDFRLLLYSLESVVISAQKRMSRCSFMFSDARSRVRGQLL